MNRPLRVLFAAMQWDYADVARGLSFEHTNMYDAMLHMDNVEVTHFDFMATHQRGGPDAVRRELLAAVDAVDPDLMFAVLFQDQIPADVLVELRDRPRPVTFNWFADDHWRFEDFTHHWAPLFNACSTTARSALTKYEAIGYDSVIKTQWACNHHLYKPTPGPPRFDVTFIGQPHGNRRDVITALRRSRVPVKTWGYGWKEGRLDQQQMIEVFGTSRINLNLSNASVTADGRSPAPAGRVERLRRLLNPRRAVAATEGLTFQDQIKGRNFEIPGTGGFQLSGASEDLASYYEPDKEIVLFSSTDELIEKAQRYLETDEERSAIATAGYRRTLAEHTYAHRYRAIFRELELW